MAFLNTTQGREENVNFRGKTALDSAEIQYKKELQTAIVTLQYETSRLRKGALKPQNTTRADLITVIHRDGVFSRLSRLQLDFIADWTGREVIKDGFN